MYSKFPDVTIDPAVEPIDEDRLVNDFKNLGVRRGDLLNIKISLKSIGFVTGGANKVIEALLKAVGPEGTIVVDTFVKVYPLPLSKKNAEKISDRFTPSYAGAVANAMIKHPKAVCSIHPVQRFTAIGALAEELMSKHNPESYAFDVLRVMAEMGGRNLKIGTDMKVVGVGTTHVAIGLLKFHQKRPRAGVNYRNEKGEIVTFERNWSGGCAVGFNNFIQLYQAAGAILSEGKVGHAESKITDMKKTLEVELEKLSKYPTFFFCDDPACASCRLSWDFSTGSKLSVKFYILKKKLIHIKNMGIYEIASKIVKRLK